MTENVEISNHFHYLAHIEIDKIYIIFHRGSHNDEAPD